MDLVNLVNRSSRRKPQTKPGPERERMRRYSPEEKERIQRIIDQDHKYIADKGSDQPDTTVLFLLQISALGLMIMATGIYLNWLIDMRELSEEISLTKALLISGSYIVAMTNLLVAMKVLQKKIRRIREERKSKTEEEERTTER